MIVCQPGQPAGTDQDTGSGGPGHPEAYARSLQCAEVESVAALRRADRLKIIKVRLEEGGQGRIVEICALDAD
jgi:hypothetical protein